MNEFFLPWLSIDTFTYSVMCKLVSQLDGMIKKIYNVEKFMMKLNGWGCWNGKKSSGWHANTQEKNVSMWCNQKSLPGFYVYAAKSCQSFNLVSCSNTDVLWLLFRVFKSFHDKNTHSKTVSSSHQSKMKRK